MASPSKQARILKLILQSSPLKLWSFTEITQKAQVTKAVANKWLKHLVNQGIIHYIKTPGQFPYYTAGKNNPVYISTKRIYALKQLHDSGLIPHLMSSSASTVILFGSMINGDWYENSDVDIFILGNLRNFDKNRFERTLNRYIELHMFENKEQLQSIQTGLINNIVNGYVVKGAIQDIMESA